MLHYYTVVKYGDPTSLLRLVWSLHWAVVEHSVMVILVQVIDPSHCLRYI